MRISDWSADVCSSDLRAPHPSVSRIAMTNAPPPPSSAAQSARTILTRLHEVMASRVNAQGKLNQVVGIIGECLDSEVCSIYMLQTGRESSRARVSPNG